MKWDGSTAGSEPATKSVPLAPVWHTVVLLVVILGISVQGAVHAAGPQGQSHRLWTYLSTGTAELLMVAWVYLGLRLRKIAFRTLFGDLSGGVRSLVLDMGLAVVFWIGALFVLGMLALVWTLIQMAWLHQLPLTPSHSLAPDPAQQHAVQTLLRLAPSDATEIAAWVVLCMIAGFAEEVVFRGYLQRQFGAWARGTAVSGGLFSALIFGAAHGYQGPRNMVLLAVFGVLFSMLAIVRRNLRVGIMAHAGHDLVAGLALAWIRTQHLL